MARRNSYPNGKWNQRPGHAYSRTDGWPTRYYQRKIGGSIVSSLAGINTTSDDFSKKEGESPYLWNARLCGTKETRKRAQSMSRMGQKFMCIPDGVEQHYTYPAGGLKVEISEQRSVKWDVFPAGRLTQVGLRFHFDEKPEGTNAHFVLILRNSKGKELCRAIKKVTELYAEGNKVVWFRFIDTVKYETVTLEATIVDDLDNSGKPTGFKMYIDADGSENHWYADHELPNLDKALREKGYKWEREVNCPITCLATTIWEPFPVWLQRGYFTAGGARYAIIGAMDPSGNKQLFKVKYGEVDFDTGEFYAVEEPKAELLVDIGVIDQNASQVRMTQAGNELFFVDGYSPLRKVNLDTWEVSESRPNPNDIDTFGFTPNMYYYANSIIITSDGFQRCKENFQAGDEFNQDDWEPLGVDDLVAWPGASLIYFLNNRLFLSGFRHNTVGYPELGPKAEPNLVIMSSIDSVKPQYDMWNKSIEFFYIPDRAPSMSAAAPVTAFASLGDYLLVFTTDGLVIETVQAAVEFAGISQTSPQGSQYGVIKQEHVAEGRNNVYFFNPTMGVMRTAGSTATQMSSPIDSIISGMSDSQKANALLVMTDELVRLYYPENEDSYQNSISLVDYITIAQHKSYWFRDNNTPVSSACIDLASDIYMAVHSQYPCLMLLDTTLKDFDCAILYEYYTKYIGTPDRLDHTIVRRIHLTTLQTYQSSVYIGLDYDHNNNPIVWRKFITPTIPGEFNNEDIFGDDNESGATNLDIRILTNDTRFVQIRMKQYCYDFQAEILQVGFEYANRTVL